MCSKRKVSSALGAPARSTNKPGLLGFHGVNSGGRLLHGLLAYHQTSNTTWCGRFASKPYMPPNPASDLLPHLSPQMTRKTFQTTISLLGSTRFSQCDQIIILPLFSLSSHGLLTGVASILFSFDLWRLRKKERLMKEVDIETGKKGLITLECYWSVFGCQ